MQSVPVFDELSDDAEPRGHGDALRRPRWRVFLHGRHPRLRGEQRAVRAAPSNGTAGAARDFLPSRQALLRVDREAAIRDFATIFDDPKDRDTAIAALRKTALVAGFGSEKVREGRLSALPG